MCSTRKLNTLASIFSVSALFILGSTIAVAKNVDYKANVEVIGIAEDDSTIDGRVFEDRNLNGVLDAGEKGIRGVMVSNGEEVVLTDAYGYYSLPAYVGMSVMVTKPAKYDLPVNEYNVPQFFYHHMPEGSPPLRFGGLAPTGPLPETVNFPLARAKNKSKKFKMIVIGDTQPYSNTEVGYVRDTLAKEFAALDLSDVEGVIVEGDVMGDDLGLFPRFKEIMSVAKSPQYYVGGNHDLDFDAPTDANSFDTFKREWGPAYYSFDQGDVHFVTLDNVEYPCINYDDQHGFCDRGDYNGIISEQQLEWLENDLAHVPEHKLIVLSMHVPIVSFVDSRSNKHQTDNAGSLYDIIGDRRALALSGHTHTLEHFEPGEGARPDVAGVDIPESPFPQIITGAGAGSWWTGDFDEEGVPMSYQRLGAKRGYLVFEFNGNTYMDTFKATGQPAEKQINASFLSPAFNDWYLTLLNWLRDGANGTPPLNFNDLEDTKILPLDEINDTYLIANVWSGSSSTNVEVYIDDLPPIAMTRSEETPDPFALEKQMAVFRYAAVSTSGNERSQGFELFTGASFGPSDPRPADEWQHVDNSNHLWLTAVPADLPVGVHTAKIVATDKFGRTSEEVIVFEVREERPAPYFRSEVFFAE